MRLALIFAAVLAFAPAHALAGEINGTNKSDTIVSSQSDDTVTTGRGADKLIVRDGAGTDHVTDFNAPAGDRILFDINGCYSDILFLGKVTDGQSVASCNGGHFEFYANGGSTMVRAYDSSTLQAVIILDGVAIDSLYGWAFQGG